MPSGVWQHSWGNLLPSLAATRQALSAKPLTSQQDGALDQQVQDYRAFLDAEKDTVRLRISGTDDQASRDLYGELGDCLLDGCPLSFEVQVRLLSLQGSSGLRTPCRWTSGRHSVPDGCSEPLSGKSAVSCRVGSRPGST